MATPERPRAAPPPAPSGAQPSRPRFHFSRGWILFGLALLAFNFYFSSRATGPSSRVRVPYSPFFLEQVNARARRRRSPRRARRSRATFTQKPQTLRRARSRRRSSRPRSRPSRTTTRSRACSRRRASSSTRSRSTPGAPWWESLLLGFGPTLLFLAPALRADAPRRRTCRTCSARSAARSARRYEPSGDRVTFADVAGIDEAKQELIEVVDFLRHPEKYRRLGGRIPHGVLLSGPPGTGKTLLARAVAGEADVPFFSHGRVASSSRRSSASAPRACATCSRRPRRPRRRSSSSTSSTRSAARAPRASAGFSGGNDEREQTLNQILTEMDGFDSSTSVIVIAATNRPDVLDQALLRPGRFDRRVAVQPPDRAGREAILKVHTRGRAARARRRPRPDRRDDAGHGRRRPREPRQRGGAARGPPRATSRSRRRTSPTRSSGSCSAPSGR